MCPIYLTSSLVAIQENGNLMHSSGCIAIRQKGENQLVYKPTIVWFALAQVTLVEHSASQSILNM